MRTLVIDTATKACSVALFEGDDCIGARHEVIGRGHAEHLLPLISALPDGGKADQIFVNVGPGSFTGIRVGVSAARALALAWNADCFGYNCLTLVAATALNQSGSVGPVDVVMNGGHSEYFFASFDPNASMVAQPQSLSMEKLLERSTADLIAGDAAHLLRTERPNATILDTPTDAKNWPLINMHPQFPPSALYGRAPDAKPSAKT